MEIQAVFDKMPKLEWLEMYRYSGNTDQCYLENYEPLWQLRQLKHLSTDLIVTDECVEAITRCCKELRSIQFGNCKSLSSKGLEAICRNVGQSLAELELVSFRYLEDEHVLNCVRTCPNLQLLIISGTSLITYGLPASVSAAKQEVSPGNVLRLELSDVKYSNQNYLRAFQEEDMYGYEDSEEEFEDLMLLMG